nr:DUF202 domain-containing protein [Rhodococcus sp. (in: high G+C Gram-positive bacteria)]
MTSTEARRFPERLYSVGTEPDPRFSFANERTFLAWIRTALALLAGGVALEALPLSMNVALRVVASAALITMGTLSAGYAWYAWFRAEKAMRLQRPLPSSVATVPLTLGIAVVGAVVFVALFFTS